MNLTNKTAIENFDLNQIQDLETARQTIVMLLNLIEDLDADNRTLREEIQRLREVIARLQGVTSKPEIKANQTTDNKPIHSNHSSEQERHQPKPRNKSRKLGVIKIDPARRDEFPSRNCPPTPPSKAMRRSWFKISKSAPTTPAW